MHGFSLGKKMTFGNAVVILFLVVTAAWAIVGIGRIVSNGEQVIGGNKLRAAMLQREVDHLNWANAVLSRLSQEKGGKLEVQVDPHKCAFGEWFYGHGRTDAEAFLPALKPILAEIEGPHVKLHESAAAIDQALAGPGGREAAVSIFRDQTAPNLATVRALLKKVATTTEESLISDAVMVSQAEKTRVTVLLLSAIAFLSGIGISFWTTRSTTRALGVVMGDIGAAASGVSTACGQLLGSSRSLADGSSSQAASLEETAAAMEQMAAMTKCNSDSAGQANSLTGVAVVSVRKADESMKRLVGRMADISATSEEIGKIIKTIDEIAFQTNLLALNAAVEAARAGEAGAGFAVVADEVRNLAQRAAGAARNTSELIEGAVGKIKEGTKLVEQTNEEFAEVTVAVNKVTELVSEVSAASSEQSRGIAEVGRAVAQMDKVTQQNAANAAEIADASEAMSDQATVMQEVVRNLQSLVHGGGPVEAPAAGRTRAGRAAPRRQLSLPSGRVG
jgi:methyl-accepting chemotaxis protein